VCVRVSQRRRPRRAGRRHSHTLLLSALFLTEESDAREASREKISLTQVSFSFSQDSGGAWPPLSPDARSNVPMLRRRGAGPPVRARHRLKISLRRTSRRRAIVALPSLESVELTLGKRDDESRTSENEGPPRDQHFKRVRAT
jgi:hypothetical protein